MPADIISPISIMPTVTTFFIVSQAFDTVSETLCQMLENVSDAWPRKAETACVMLFHVSSAAFLIVSHVSERKFLMLSHVSLTAFLKLSFVLYSVNNPPTTPATRAITSPTGPDKAAITGARDLTFLKMPMIPTANPRAFVVKSNPINAPTSGIIRPRFSATVSKASPASSMSGITSCTNPVMSSATASTSR